MATVSIIVPTHSRRNYLSACLDSLSAQSVQPKEIIVVDDASTDDTSVFLQTCKISNLRIIRLDQNVGVAEARNLAARQATGDYIFFIDDDCWADRAWVEHLLSAFESNQIDFAFGQTIYRAAGYRGYFPERIVDNQGGRWPGSGNIGFRRTIFLSTGGFDPVFLRYQNEDTEFAIRLVSRGHHYRKIPEAIVFHQAGQWSAAGLLKSSRNVSVWPIIKKKYPRHWREFGPNFFRGVIFAPMELLVVLTAPLSILLLFVRYLIHGQRRIGIFFVKYPAFIFLRRLWLWGEAIRQGQFMV